MQISSELDQRIRLAIRDIPDFPQAGILFKDVTPIFLDPALCQEILETFASEFPADEIDAIVGVESRGFLFGLALAVKLKKPFVLVRKAGKLPYKTVRHSYQLEYGTAEMEMHIDAIQPGWRVLIHDDLLATGGTASAAAHLVETQGATVTAFSFLVNLSFLPGKQRLEFSFPKAHIGGLVSY